MFPTGRFTLTRSMMMKNRLSLTPKDYLSKNYVRRLEPDEGGGYVASILEFPGCIAEGESADEALENLRNAAESWIEVALSEGQYIRDPIDFDGFSGKIALRMPRTLHKQAAELAELENCSLNQLFVTAIALYVGGKPLADKISELVSITNNLNIFSIPNREPLLEQKHATLPYTYKPGFTSTINTTKILSWSSYLPKDHDEIQLL